jgi:hypothetical protein
MPRGGKIKVRTSVQNNINQVVFSDSGFGMSEEVSAKSFLPFFTTKNNGTGLGLALTKEIVEAAKRKILVNSKLGVGTTFTFEFPA